MENVEYIARTDLDATLAAGVTHWYIDYCHKEIRPKYIESADTFPFDGVDGDKRVFLLGVTLDADEMAKLLDRAGDVVWIDNQMNLIEQLYASDEIGERLQAVKGKRAGDRALCELTWDAYFEWMNARPKFVDLVGSYTRKDASFPDYETRAVPFARGLGFETPDPFNDEAFEGLYKKVLCLRRVPEVEEEFVQHYISKGFELMGKDED